MSDLYEELERFVDIKIELALRQKDNSRHRPYALEYDQWLEDTLKLSKANLREILPDPKNE